MRTRLYNSFPRAHILGNIREVLLGENLTEEFLGTRVWFLFFSSSWITNLESIYIYIFLKSTFEDVHDYSFPRMHILGNIRKTLLGENVTEEFLEIRVWFLFFFFFFLGSQTIWRRLSKSLLVSQIWKIFISFFKIDVWKKETRTQLYFPSDILWKISAKSLVSGNEF